MDRYLKSTVILKKIPNPYNFPKDKKLSVSMVRAESCGAGMIATVSYDKFGNNYHRYDMMIHAMTAEIMFLQKGASHVLHTNQCLDFYRYSK